MILQRKCGGKLKKGGKCKDGGKPLIRIKPSKRGSFTAWCKQNGYGGVTQQCIAKGKNGSTAIKKKAIFAQNARKWKH